MHIISLETIIIKNLHRRQSIGHIQIIGGHKSVTDQSGTVSQS